VTVIPAKAGIQKIWCQTDWMPAFAGMTEKTPRPLKYLILMNPFMFKGRLKSDEPDIITWIHIQLWLNIRMLDNLKKPN
jgi:hypothetical protein